MTCQYTLASLAHVPTFSSTFFLTMAFFLFFSFYSRFLFITERRGKKCKKYACPSGSHKRFSTTSRECNHDSSFFFLYILYFIFSLSLSRALCFSVLRFSFSCHRHRSEGKVIKNEEKKTISIER